MYQVNGSVGPQALASKKNASSPLFGSGERFKNDYTRRAAEVPGPGPADIDAFTRPNYGKFSFSKSTAAAREKVYISAEHEKCSTGRDAPGPGTYDVKGLTGTNLPSGNKTRAAPSYTWGAAKQRPDAQRDDTPGPGQYVV